MLRRDAFKVSIASALLVALAGCSGPMHRQGPMYGPGGAMTRLSAQLNGAQEVPPRSVPGTGSADVDYDANSGVLRWRVSYGGLTGPLTGAHFHGPAPMGSNAGIVVPIANAPSPIVGEARITPAQANDLMAGRWYVNLHTAANPAGEIRGQVIKR